MAHSCRKQRFFYVYMWCKPLIDKEMFGGCNDDAAYFSARVVED